MTALVRNPPAPPLSVTETRGLAATAAESSAASDELQRQQADEHWERWLDKGIRRDQALRRRFQVIGSVVGIGVAAAAVWMAL